MLDTMALACGLVLRVSMKERSILIFLTGLYHQTGCCMRDAHVLASTRSGIPGLAQPFVDFRGPGQRGFARVATENVIDG
jgi:hypothetical protein